MALTSPETFTEQDKADLLGAVDEVASILGPSRPSPAKVTRARTLVKDIRVTCQTIPVSPITDDGTVTPPTPGPETPPIEPAPPETPPSGGGGGGSSSPPTTTTVTTTYTSQGDFSGSQGYRGWYYLSEDGTSMTYSAGSQLWSGTELYQGIWSSGQHPGGTNGAMRRWTAQATGTFSITGHIFDSDISALGNNVTVQIKKNGAAIYGPQTIVSGDSVGYDISNVTGNCTAGDTFDFLVKGVGGIAFASTGLAVSISLTTTTTTGSGSTTQTTLPFTLNGTAPEEGTYTITANKPSNADGCTINITGVNLAASYGRCYVNGSTNSVAVWATAPGNAGISATVSLAIPVAYMTNGSNTLRFTHDSGTGYTVTAVGTPAFTTPTTPTPPATQTSLPFDLRGSILPEDAILTTSLTKPSNANGATMTVTGVNLTGTMGSYYINGSLAGSIWGTTPANAGVSSTVTLTPSVSLFSNGSNAIRFTHTAGGGYTVSAVSVSFSTPTPGTTPPDPPSSSTAWGSLPSGMTTALDWPFSQSVPSVILNVFNNQAYATDATAPLSPPYVFDSFLPANATIGGGQWVLPLAHVREVFVGFWWKQNADFEGNGGSIANKVIFISGDRDNNFLNWKQYSGKNLPGTLIWSVQQTSGANNCHASGYVSPGCTLGPEWGPGTGEFSPNVGSGQSIAAGSGWHKVEIYQKASTSITSQDGVIRIALDGSPYMNYSNVNLAPTGFTDVQINHTWDGTFAYGPSGRDMSKTWHHYFDHFYVATR